MGLIQAALSAAGSTVRDSWKEYFYCDAIPADTIAVKAHKRTRGLSANYGDDNVITDGSVIAVADGQCMVIVEQGKVVDICAEPGEYRYDSTIAPSLLTGTLKESVKAVFEEIGKRFVFGGQASADQRVYYFNTKEIPGIKYGTPNPIPFKISNPRMGLELETTIKCFGEYTIRVCDPILFYTNVSGNFAETYKVAQISDTLRSELLTALQPAFFKLSQQGVLYSDLPAHTTELADALNEQLSAKWRDLRGIEIVSFGVSSITGNEADAEKIKELQLAATYMNKEFADAQDRAARNKARVDAANNEGGAALGFINLGMAEKATADVVGAVTGTPEPAGTAWTCPTCGQVNHDNFCSKCGTKRPEGTVWYCPKCGAENDGNFCTKCGTKKPE